MLKNIYLLAITCAMLYTACKTPQKTIYFRENTPIDQSVQVQKIDRLKEAIVQPGDVIAISVTSPSGIVDPKAVNIFNEGGTSYGTTPMAGGGAPAAAAPVTGSNAYRVDEDGYIDYPIIGKLKISSFTIRQLKDLLDQKLVSYVKDPVVEARIVNYKITVLGEVGHPGPIVAPNQKINIIDALAAAGDVPITGRKDNVLVIRETEGNREYARLNLNSRNVFNSPYYYLRQNDIVYVEPARVKRQQSNEFLQFYLPVITTLLSVGITVYGITAIQKK